jgi:MinD-like ATPase involved in chromosome partitioning or flagellar assembly
VREASSLSADESWSPAAVAPITEHEVLSLVEQPSPTSAPSTSGVPAEAPYYPSPAFQPSSVVRPRRSRPDTGWRSAVYALTGGLWNPGISAKEATRRELSARVRTHLPGWHSITVSSMKGGVGKTTITAVLGLTLAEHRGDRIVALDANPDAGTLADRLTGHVGITLRDLIDNLDTITSWTDIAHYTSLAGRLQVLASEQDPAMSEAFSREEYQAVVTVLARFYNIILTDSGTGVVHSAMGGALDGTHTLVLAGAPNLDGASRASKTLDWLEAHGYGDLARRAIVVLTFDRCSPFVDPAAIRAHFAARCRAVIDIPPDPHLAIGGLIDLSELRPGTRDAFLELAALAAEQFSWQPTAPAAQHVSTERRQRAGDTPPTWTTHPTDAGCWSSHRSRPQGWPLSSAWGSCPGPTPPARTSAR